MTKPARRRWWLKEHEEQFYVFNEQEFKVMIPVIEAPHDSVVLSREDAKDIYEFVIMAKKRRKLQYELKEILEGAMKN